jgi:SAM-dependent MidA family methyltransferase
MRAGQFCEYYVGINDDGGFEWSIGPLSTPRLAEYFKHFNIQIAEDRIAEVNLEAENWLAQVAEKLKRGFLVIVDYGAEADELYQSTRYQDGTLRAFSRHRFAEDVLASPQEQDITTTIDWTFVKDISERLGFELAEFQRQDRFLRNAGLLEELEARASEARDESERSRIRTSAREMILPESMAASFQVLVLKKATNLKV